MRTHRRKTGRRSVCKWNAYFQPSVAQRRQRYRPCSVPMLIEILHTVPFFVPAKHRAKVPLFVGLGQQRNQPTVRLREATAFQARNHGGPVQAFPLWRQVRSHRAARSIAAHGTHIALAGRKDKARAMMGGIEDQARERCVCGFNVACVHSVLGEKDQAFACLEKAHRDRSD